MNGLKKEVVTVPAWPNSRDTGKRFLITEMVASRAEKWAWRAFLLLRDSNQRIPDDVQGLGMVGIAILGLNVFLSGSIKPDELMPLLDEMLTCVQIIRDPSAVDKITGGPVATPIVSDDDIQEVQTRLWLRGEVLRVHTGFSVADAVSSLISTVLSAKSVSPST